MKVRKYILLNYSIYSKKPFLLFCDVFNTYNELDEEHKRSLRFDTENDYNYYTYKWIALELETKTKTK